MAIRRYVAIRGAVSRYVAMSRAVCPLRVYLPSARGLLVRGSGACASGRREAPPTSQETSERDGMVEFHLRPQVGRTSSRSGGHISHNFNRPLISGLRALWCTINIFGEAQERGA